MKYCFLCFNLQKKQLMIDGYNHCEECCTRGYCTDMEMTNVRPIERQWEWKV